ncbi:MAG: ABC transporter ATP-binding protein [Alphaproteobacteria bacterium]|nr:ABC transporter ATP-binding protein [Alphaproteobacteria bacterium]
MANEVSPAAMPTDLQAGPGFIRIRHLTKRFGANAAVNDVSFAVEQGRTVALLGPSGCGKTTILRCIAGLETPDDGDIAIAGKPVFDAGRVDLAPEKRELGIVFQSYAVWPHMTVAENVAFPLKVRGVPTGERTARARRMLETVGLAGFEDRPATLVSGGQQQRIALARALVHEPRLVLFDEALSNLDAQLREQMRLELRLLQQRLGFTAIYVTHDQAEAFGLADTVVLMNHGVIETAGPAREVFRRPTSAFVARFFGLNVLEAQVRGRGPEGLDIALAERLVIRAPAIDGVNPGDPVLACIRKEHVRVERAADAPNPTDGAIVAASFLGTAEEYLVELLGVSLRAVRPAAGFARGDRVRVATAAEDWIVLPKER